MEQTQYGKLFGDDSEPEESKKMEGRKPKYTPERVAKICNAIAEGKSEKDACLAAEITTMTFHSWLASKNEFSEAVKKAKQWYDKHILEDAERGLECSALQQARDR